MTTVRPRRHRWLHAFRTRRSPLLFSSAVYAVMIVLFTAGLVLDDRVITGAPAWLKPLKFAVSSLMYSLTLLWILSFVRHRPRLVNGVAWANGAALLAELSIILFQAARGTTSHFNVTTPLNRTLYLIMAGAVGVLRLTHLIVTLVVAFQRFERPSFALSLRLGLTLTLIGMSFGFLMVSPLGTLLASGQGVKPPILPTGIIGAHSIGVPDGSPGLPLVGWSTVGGDLRVGHFIGLHALQLLPLFAWLLTRRPRLSEAQRVGLVWTTGFGYLGVMLLTTWQALRAQPLTAPDHLTLSVLAGLVILVAGLAGVISNPGRRKQVR
jgi:hypothetical protein